LRPTYLPYRIPLTTTNETPLPQDDPSGWRLGYETPGRPQIAIYEAPAAAASFPGPGRLITAVSAAGYRATVTGRRTGLGAMYALTRTAHDWTRRISVEAPPGAWRAVISELVKTAESMR
jgi:hypothetical protein